MTIRNKLARYTIIGFAIIGAFWLSANIRQFFFGINYGEIVSKTVSIDSLLTAYVTNESGFGSITPDITRVVISERSESVNDGQYVLHGSNLSDIKLRWINKKRLLIELPCSRFRSQNYYSSKDYSKNIEIVIQTPDPSCWNNQQ